MGENLNNWYERFFKTWAIFMGILVTSGLLRGQGLYYPDSSSMIGNVMFVVIQILCVAYSSLLLFNLLLFKFVKPLHERKEGKVDD